MSLHVFFYMQIKHARLQFLPFPKKLHVNSGYRLTFLQVYVASPGTSGTSHPEFRTSIY
jgi:hypothetical protein